MSDSGADAYVRRGSGSVPGWFHPADVLLFRAINGLQAESGVSGDLLEIGTYLGKSAILLGFFTRPGEHVVACDLFDTAIDDTLNAEEVARQYGGLSRQAFDENWLRFHASLPETVVGPSSTLRGRLHGNFRFIHIDGSHLYRVVRDDIALARDIAVPGGVVVLDDIRSSHSPGVAAAAWRAVATEDLTPFCYSHKLYATWGAHPTLNADALAIALEGEPGITTALDEIDDHPVLVVEHRTSPSHHWARELVPPVLVRQLLRRRGR